MKEHETIRTTFLQDTKMTPGIIRLIGRMVKNSVMPIKAREEAKKERLQALEKATAAPKRKK